MPYTYTDLITDLQFKVAFTTTDADRIALINQTLEESECMIINEAWTQRCPNTFRTKAIFLLAAHQMAQYDRINSAPVNADGIVDTSLVSTGTVSSMSVAVGSNSVSFTQPDPDKVGGRWGDWVETVWGMQLIEIVNRYKMRYTGFVA